MPKSPDSSRETTTSTDNHDGHLDPHAKLLATVFGHHRKTEQYSTDANSIPSAQSAYTVTVKKQGSGKYLEKMNAKKLSSPRSIPLIRRCFMVSSDIR